MLGKIPQSSDPSPNMVIGCNHGLVSMMLFSGWASKCVCGLAARHLVEMGSETDVVTDAKTAEQVVEFLGGEAMGGRGRRSESLSRSQHEQGRPHRPGRPFNSLPRPETRNWRGTFRASSRQRKEAEPTGIFSRRHGFLS